MVVQCLEHLSQLARSLMNTARCADRRAAAIQGESPHAEVREPLLPARTSRSPTSGRLETRSRGYERRVSSHGTGVGKATLGAVIERIAVLVDGGHGRRTTHRCGRLQARCRAERGHVRGIADKGDAVVTPTASEQKRNRNIK